MRRIAIINFFCLIGLTVVAVFITGCDISTSDDSEMAFEDTFGHPPPTSIINLYGRTYAFRDSGYCFVRFGCSFANFKHLIGPTFSTMTSTALSDLSNNGFYNEPSWWDPFATGLNAITAQESTSIHPTFFQGTAYAFYNATTNTAYVYWKGYD